MNNYYQDIKEALDQGAKPMIMYYITKEEVLTLNTNNLDKIFNTVKQFGKRCKQCVAIFCSGYDDVPDELFEIMELRKYIRHLFDKHPYMFYYLTTELGIEQWLLACLFDFETAFHGEKLNDKEIWERYGMDFDAIPKMGLKLINNENMLQRILKGIIVHGKSKKDAIGSKRIAIEYARNFDSPLKVLEEVGISEQEARELGF